MLNLFQYFHFVFFDYEFVEDFQTKKMIEKKPQCISMFKENRRATTE